MFSPKNSRIVPRLHLPNNKLEHLADQILGAGRKRRKKRNRARARQRQKDQSPPKTATCPYMDHRWRALRKVVLTRDNFMCRRCESKDPPFHVHHLKYPPWGTPLWEIDPIHLLTLCEACHLNEHDVISFSGNRKSAKPTAIRPINNRKPARPRPHSAVEPEKHILSWDEFANLAREIAQT